MGKGREGKRARGAHVAGNIHHDGRFQSATAGRRSAGPQERQSTRHKVIRSRRIPKPFDLLARPRCIIKKTARDLGTPPPVTVHGSLSRPPAVTNLFFITDHVVWTLLKML